MVFSQESSQALFEMGNVELIELKKSRIQCPSCLHYAFTGAILCHSGKHTRPDLEMMRRMKVAFEILLAQYFRTSACSARVANTAPTYGGNITTKQNTHYEERKRAKEILRRSGIDGKMMRPTGSLSLSMICRMLGPYCTNRYLP